MSVFTNKGRGLLDFAVCLLCLWVAWQHTPAGAIARKVSAWVVGTKSTAKPLLAYYGGATGLAIRSESLPTPPPLNLDGLPIAQRRLFQSGEPGTLAALSYGTFAAVAQLEPRARESLRKRAAEEGVESTLLDTPEGYALLLSKLKPSFPTDDSAVLAIFAGRVPVSYAQERVRADDGTLTIDRLAWHLPSGLDRETVGASQALAFATAYALRWPVAESTPITSPFGYRTHPVLGTKKLHTGVDLGVPIGTEVRAVHAGIVRRASSDNVNGRVLVIDHGNGVTSAYCHNDSLEVEVGAEVKAGEVISLSGNTGRSTGPHLHYQLEITDQPVDPLQFRQHPGVVARESM